MNRNPACTKIDIVREFQRLKEHEHEQIDWSAKRELSKINYRIHADASRHNLILEELTPQQTFIIYANEADVLNVALLGMTAKEWREANHELRGNILQVISLHFLFLPDLRY